VKVITSGREFTEAAGRMERCLQEFRIRGVKTNIPFLINLITHESFLAGKCTTRFLDETPELFTFKKRADRATKRALTEPERTALVGGLRALGAKVEAGISVDESLIGGFVARVGSRQFDASVKAKLDALRLALKSA